MSKDMDLPFARNTSDKYEKKLLDTATKARIEDASKTAFKKVVHKTVKATEELIRNEITENILKPTYPWCKFEECWRNSYSTREKRGNILRKIY